MTALEPKSQSAEGQAPQTVLIVDDEAATRTLLRKTVEGLSTPCRVLEAGDGDSALEMGRQQRPDLVLLDIVLPGSSASGVLVCQELCKDSRVKVVIVSGKASGPVANACLQMGAIELIKKPFVVDAVREKIERWLAG